MKIPQNSHQHAPTKQPPGFHDDRGMILGTEVVENAAQEKFTEISNAPSDYKRRFKAVHKKNDAKPEKAAKEGFSALRKFFPGHKHK